MKTPELSVLHSGTVATELAFGQLALTPSGEDLAALTDRLGIKAPDTLTAALVYPNDRVLFSGAETTEDPSKADAASEGMQDLSVFPDGTLPVRIDELSEQNILEGFARSLAVRAQFNQRMRVLKWGASAFMAEVGVGSTIQGMGSNWGLLGIPLAGATIGGIWLWHRGWRNTQLVVPSLEGLESPVRVTSKQT